MAELALDDEAQSRLQPIRFLYPWSFSSGARATITDEERDRLRGKRARVALGIVCGEFSPAPDQPALSMPALSAAPGVLLAAELVKERLGGAPSLSPERNHLAASILAGPHARWSTWRGKRVACACTDEGLPPVLQPPLAGRRVDQLADR